MHTATNKRSKLYWAFYKSTITINLVVSLMLFLVTGVSITVFAVSLVTAGLFFAFLYKEIWRPREYYFYYNWGISKVKLMLFCVLVNILPAALILTTLFHVTSA